MPLYGSIARSLMCAAAATLLGGCFRSNDLLYPSEGVRIDLTNASYACGWTDNTPLQVKRFREIHKGGGKYVYVEIGPSGPVAQEHSFHPLREKKYLLVTTYTGKDGPPFQTFLPVHVAGSSLIGMRPTEDRTEALAKQYGVEIKYSSGNKIDAMMEGPAQAKRAFIQEVARTWKDIVPYFLCVPAL